TDRDAIDRYFPVGRRMPLKLALMSAGESPGNYYLILPRNHVFRSKTQIRKGLNEDAHVTFVGFRTHARAAGDGDVWSVQDMAWGHQFVHKLDPMLIPDLFVEAANDGLIFH